MRMDGTKYTFSHKTQFGDLHCVVLPDVGELAVIPGAEPAHEESLGVGGRDVHRHIALRIGRIGMVCTNGNQKKEQLPRGTRVKRGFFLIDMMMNGWQKLCHQTLYTQICLDHAMMH